MTTFPQCRFLYEGEHNAQGSGFAQITLLKQYCCKKATSLQRGAADVLQWPHSDNFPFQTAQSGRGILSTFVKQTLSLMSLYQWSALIRSTLQNTLVQHQGNTGSLCEKGSPSLEICKRN